MIIIAILFVLVILNFAGQSISQSNLKHNQRAHMQAMTADFAQREREMARARDEYYDPIVKKSMPWFYSDGSLKRDPLTGNTYGKGQYYSTSHGLDCNLRDVASNVKRPPSA